MARSGLPMPFPSGLEVRHPALPAANPRPGANDRPAANDLPAARDRPAAPRTPSRPVLAQGDRGFLVAGASGKGAAGGFRLVLGPCLALLAILAAAPRTDAQTTLVLKSLKVTLPTSNARFPAGAGADVADANCLACHSVGMILNQPIMPRAAWEAEVNKMRNVYKAPVEASSVAAITDYLTSIKGPKQ